MIDENPEVIVENENEPAQSRAALFWDIYKTRFWELFYLNLIFVITCIPIITIGPATCGLVKVVLNYSCDRQTYIWSDFWKGFKENFGKSLLISIPLGLFSIGCGCGVFLYIFLAATKSAGWYVLLGAVILIFIALSMMTFYAYIMLVITDLSVPNIYKNSLIFSIVSLKMNFLILLMCLVLIAITLLLSWYAKFMTLLFLFIPFAFNWFVICFKCYPIIYKYAIEPYYNN
jgi:uncharacterized membrane protein YesL